MRRGAGEHNLKGACRFRLQRLLRLLHEVTDCGLFEKRCGAVGEGVWYWRHEFFGASLELKARHRHGHYNAESRHRGEGGRGLDGTVRGSVAGVLLRGLLAAAGGYAQSGHAVVIHMEGALRNLLLGAECRMEEQSFTYLQREGQCPDIQRHG